MNEATKTANEAAKTANEAAKTTGQKSAPLSDDYDELLESLQQALEWARGERELRSIVRSSNDQWYADPDAASASKESVPVVSLPLKPSAKQ